MTHNLDLAKCFDENSSPEFLISKELLGAQMRNSEVDRLLTLPLDQGLRVIIESIPSLGNVSWLEFQQCLANRLTYSEKAKSLLIMAGLMVVAENSLQNIVNNYDVKEACRHLDILLLDKNKVEQFAIIAFLRFMAKSDKQANAILEIYLKKSQSKNK